MPLGGQAGTTVDVKTTGSDLEGLNTLHFSHPGIKAVRKADEPIALVKPLEPKFTVAIRPDVEPGLYEVWAIGAHGLSNSRVFVVGDLTEKIENKPNQAPDQASEMHVGSVVNATADAKLIDYFKFEAKKSQRIVIDCHAERIDSRMDATLVLFDSDGHEIQQNRDTRGRDPLLDFVVPSDGTYVIKVFDALYKGGSEHYYRLSVSTNPYIDFILPSMGKPGTKGKYTLYGRNLPGSEPASDVFVHGNQLEKLTVSIQIPGLNHTTMIADPGQRPGVATFDSMVYRFYTTQSRSNPVSLAYATAPVQIEQEPNDTPNNATKVQVPCEISGRFNHPDPTGATDEHAHGDMDWFTFDAKQGDVYQMEVYCHRLGVPTDPILLIQQITKDDQGQELIKDLNQTDDLAPTSVIDNSGVMMVDRGLGAAINDPVWHFEAPEDGTYRVLLRDLKSSPRGDLVYRLAIRSEQGDFRLVALNYPWSKKPQSLRLRQGGVEMIKVLAFRRDGFDGAIDVSIPFLPPGVNCEETTILPKANSAVLVLRAADEVGASVGQIRVIGRARIGDTEIVREARCAHLSWKESATARMTGSIPMTVDAGWRVPFTVELPHRLHKFRAGKFNIPIKINRREGWTTPVTLTLKESVHLKPNSVKFEGDKTEGNIELEVKPEAVSNVYDLPLLAEAEFQYPRTAESAAVAGPKQEIDRFASRAAAKVKLAEQARDQAQEQLTTAETEQKDTKAVQQQADTAIKEAQGELEIATTKLNQAKEAILEDPSNQALIDAVTAARQAATKVAAHLATVQKAKAASDKAVTDTNAKHKAATETKAASDKAVTEAQNLNEKAEAAKAAIGTLAGTAPVQTAKIKINLPVDLIRLVPTAPIDVKLAQAKVSIMQGGQIEIPMTIERVLGFNGEVTIKVALPEPVKGINLVGNELKIAKGQRLATLKIETVKDATVGEHSIIIKSQVRLADQDLVLDRPLQIKVEASPAEDQPTN